jgi:DNA-binding winged helix-turn-helix (wHTH) protein/dipeptidyl aminopeptidase/acylaminoacyl peptidase
MHLFRLKLVLNSRHTRLTFVEEAVYSPRIVRFGVFEVDLQAGELRKAGLKLKLTGQPFQVFAILLARPGEVVTREELQKRLWPDTFVDIDHNLNAAVNKIREALGDSAETPIFIETLARRGYRFIAPVNGASVPVPAPGSSSKLRGWAIVAMIDLVFVGAAAWLLQRRIPNPESTLTAHPFTASSGNAVWSSFSPDGQQVTFAWDKNRGWRWSELFVQSVGGSGPPLQLTHTAAPAFLGSAVTAWTPDGKWITYERYNPKPGQRPIQIVLTPAPAGGPEVVVQRINGGECGLSWSPDGKYLAFTDRDLQQEPYAVFLLQRDTLERRRLTSPPKGMFGGDRNAEFSHDGNRIAFVRDLNGGTQIAVLTIPSGSIQMLDSGPGTINKLAWAPSDRDIIYGSEVAGFARLWRISSTGGEPRPLGIGEHGWAPAVSERAHRLAYGLGIYDSNIWANPSWQGPNRITEPVDSIQSAGFSARILA